MIIYDPLHPLQSGLIQLVGAYPGKTVDEILDLLKTNLKITISKQNIYKVIAKLIEHQMFAKEGQLLFLHRSWVENSTDMFNNFQTFQTTLEKHEDILLEEGGRKKFYESSLAQLDVLWGQIIEILVKTISEKEYFVYHAHPYYRIGMAETEHRFFSSMDKKGITTYQLGGNTTFLDKYSIDSHSIKGTIDVLTDTPPFLKQGYLLNVYDDYIFEIILPKETSKKFEFFYDTVTDISQFDPQYFSDIFKMKARTKLTYWRSKKDAQILKDKFRSYFI